MNSKVGSLEEKVKLPPTETISRCYQPQQGNRKVIRILTVAVYVLCVSLAAIMLSLYYIFIWDPTIRPFVTKGNNCEKIVIPEKIAIRLLNSSEVTAEQFYRHILEQYRILNLLQQQRQQFLQKQHLQLQQLAAANRFQEIFATATIIQSNPNDRIKKPITPTNGTFLLEQPREPLPPPVSINGVDILDAAHVPILDTAPAVHMIMPKRKQHRKHYGNGHHRRTQKNHKKLATAGAGAAGSGAGILGSSLNTANATPSSVSSSLFSSSSSSSSASASSSIGSSSGISSSIGGIGLDTSAGAEHDIIETPLNQPTAIIQEPLVYTSMPIPLILSSGEDKRPAHHSHAHVHGDRRGGNSNGRDGGPQSRKRTASSATISSYDTQSYLNPFLTGELIFEK